MLAYPPNHSLPFPNSNSLNFFNPNTRRELEPKNSRNSEERVLMGEKRLDFDAPLLSVRRIVAKTEQKANAFGSPGVIPFTWELAPGKPKGPGSGRPPAVPRLPPDRIVLETEEKDARERDDGDAFVDAVELLSRSDSSLDCSVSGCSGSSDTVEPSESFSKDPEVRELMMGRFLPAAKAMATGPLQNAAPKDPGEKAGDVNYRRSPVRLPYQHRPTTVSKFAYDQEEEVESYVDEDKEEEGYGGAAHFSRACGLIPRICLKSSFLLLNPVPGMKVSGHLPPGSQISSSDQGSLARSTDESWDAVYEYKVGHRDDYLEDGSKLTSESNQLTCWSDSQTLDESSFYHSPQSPCREGKGSLGVLRRELKGRKTISFDWCERSGEKYGKLRPGHGMRQGSGSMSPSIDRTLYVDSVQMMETSSSKLSSVDTVANTSDEKFGIEADGSRIEDDPVPETCAKDELQPKISESAEAGLSSRPEPSKFEGMNRSNDNEQALKVEDEEKDDAGLALSVLLPPLPKSPSESWLQRTLPSVSSKYPSSNSLLGIQVQHRKQASWASSKDFKWANDVGAQKQQPQQTRFAQVLRKPAIP